MGVTVVINDTPTGTTAQSVDNGPLVEVRQVTETVEVVGAVKDIVTVVSEQANYGAPGPQGPPGVHVGPTPPEDLNTLWVKI